MRRKPAISAMVLVLAVAGIAWPSYKWLLAASCNMTEDGNGDVTLSTSCTLSPGTYNITRNLIIAPSVTVSPASDLYGSIIINAVDVSIGTGAVLNVDGMGYLGVMHGDVPYHDCMPGGSHGGQGTSCGSYTSDPTFDSVSMPTSTGGGGHYGTYAGGGRGGGALRLNLTGTLTLNGTISAAGGAGPYPRTGGGAGGSVLIQADTLAGNGTIRANGGNGDACGGGGGRIAVHYTNGSPTAYTYQSYGGNSSFCPSGYGAAGTAFYKQTAATNGSLIVDNNNYAYIGDRAFTNQVNAADTFESVLLRNGARYRLSSGQSLTTPASISGNYTSLQPKLIVTSGATFNPPAANFTLVGFNLENHGTVNTITALTCGASSRLAHDAATGTFPAGLSSVTVESGGALSSYGLSTISIPTVTVKSGGTLTHEDNSTAQTHALTLSATDLTVETGGTVNVDGLGYDGGPYNGTPYGPGSPVTTLHGNSGGAGGGYGGDGAVDGGRTVAGGATYGSVKQPSDIGSGGGYGTNGGVGKSGGGAIKLVVSGTFTNNGTVSSNGTPAGGTTGGGGSGGSVWIDAGTLAGTGIIKADGTQPGCCNAGGGGGGGRVAIYYTNGSPTSYTLQSLGGVGYSGGLTGGAGTIFTKSSAQTNGNLQVANANTTVGAYTTQVDTTVTFDNATIKEAGLYRIPAGKTMTVTAGGSLAGGGTVKGSITVAPGGTYNMPSSTVTNIDLINNGTSVIPSTGSIAVQSATVTNNSLMVNVNAINMTATGTFVNNGAYGDGSVGAPSRVGALTLRDGENYTSTSVIDRTNGYLYVATGGDLTAPARIVKIRLSDYSETASLTLNAGEMLMGTSVIDATGTYAYFGTQTTQGIVVKVRLSDMVRMGAATLGATEGHLVSGVIDPAGAFGYFGTDEGDCEVVKVNLSSMARVGALGCQAGEDYLESAVIDGTGTYAYFTANTNPSKIIQVKLSDFTRNATLTLDTNETVQAAGVIDAANGYAYFGTYTIPGRVVKVRLSDFSRLGATSLSTGEDALFVAAIDTVNGYAYFRTDTANQKIVKVALGAGDSLPVRTSVGTLNVDRDYKSYMMTMDPAAGFIYTGSSEAPARILRYTTGFVTSALSSVTVGGGATLIQSSSSDSYSNTPITVKASSYLSQQGVGTIWGVGDLTVENGGTIMHEGNTTVRANLLSVSAANIDLQSGSTATAMGRGFQDNYGPGYGTLGGNYGGTACYSSNTYTTYGYAAQPFDLGSGGDNDSNAHGGGAIKLAASGTLTINGTINANAGDSSYASGSGGSVWLQAGVLAGGAGTVKADADPNSNFGGGGGRVAVYYTTNTSSPNLLTTSGKITALGSYGSSCYGGAGTLFVKQAAATYGDLIVDNASHSQANARTIQATTPSQTYANIIIRNGGRYVVPSGFTLGLATGGTMTGTTATPSLTIASGGTFSAPSTAMTLTGPETIYNNGTFATVRDLTVGTGVTMYHSTATGAFSAGLTSLTVAGGSFGTSGTGTLSVAGDVVCQTGSLTHLANTNTQANKLIISATNIDVQAGCSVTAQGKGFSGNNSGPGYDCMGGSYGGTSCYYADKTSYGSVTEPTDLGSGSCASGNGGGAIKLTATNTLTVNGDINASSQNVTDSYGLAGGSVWLQTGTLAGGAGTIKADADPDAYYGAGGGRIAVHYTNNTSSPNLLTTSGKMTAYGSNGGNCKGGAGTIFTKQAVATNGDLAVTNGGYSSAYGVTPLVAATSNTFNNVVASGGGRFALPATASLAVAGSFDVTGTGSAFVLLRTDQISIDTIHVHSGGTITHGDNSTSRDKIVNLACRSLLIDAGASINVDGLGYDGSTGDGQGIDADTAGGAGYCGVGGNGSTPGAGGPAYGSATSPTGLGSGGGNDSDGWGGVGGAGGGEIRIAASEDVVVNGTISADGRVGTRQGGGGSGGTIHMTAGSLSGSGSIGADGGGGSPATADTYGGGGGSGGRVRIVYASSTFSGAITEVGGAKGGVGGSSAATAGTTCSPSIEDAVPTVTGVSSTAADGSYGSGEVIPVTVTFSEPVTVSTLAGTPRLLLETGDTDRYATYASGSGTATLTFNYTVVVGDTAADLDYAATSALNANGGTIRDIANDATLTLPTPGASGSLAYGKAIVVSTNALPAVTAYGVSPSPLRTVDDATLSATATDEGGVARLEIRLDSVLIKTCEFTPATSPASCSYLAGRLSRGAHTAVFTAYDNTAQQNSATYTFKSAASTRDNRLILSTVHIGEVANTDLYFTLAGEDDGLLTVTFPAGFTVMSAADPLQSTSPCLSDFSYDAQHLYATKTSCPAGPIMLRGATVLNPTTPGDYIIRWTNDNGETTVIILANNDLQVAATVDPQLSFEVGADTTCTGGFTASDWAVDLGRFSTGRQTASSGTDAVDLICTRLSTNATSGAVVTVRNQNGADGLKSASKPADLIGSTTGSIAAGTPRYGLCYSSVSGDNGYDTGLTPAANAPSATFGTYGGAACTATASGEAVTALSTSPLEAWRVSGVTSNAYAALRLKAAISATQPAHNDYTDALTFIATATY